MAAALNDFYPGDEVTVYGEKCFIIHSGEDHVSLSGEPYGGGWKIFGGIGPGQVRLVRRGNVFRHQFQMELLSFTDLDEELRFWSMTGKLQEVPNHRNGMYFWDTLDDATADLNSGVIDALLGAIGMPGMSMDYVHFGGYILKAPHPVRSRIRHAGLVQLQGLEQI